ncbi:restriction endonuclease subunit S [Haemophilus parainfluenzae]|uniref:restriction endonuclease subunit S n=1 Tax=Haemophilus parainfluenzae TaxID=729 RepID=UPI00122CBA81|nr:restriction endonuclease subunit S [Haemophilus parainfluenzae]KAB1991630.1 restriction endonuclease subunit S [Haemophilus parainfluenzae]QAT95307.2 restriction endonuclease subunit S [Haemophilus parainfluenzae]
MKNNRTFLEKLLDGAEVKWIPLGDVADYEQPTKYLVNSTVYNDNYPTPVLTAGKTFILGYTNEDEGIYFASKSPVIIFDDFTTANKWVDFDFKAKSSAMKMITSKNEKFALLKYIYYWLNTLPNNQTDGDHKRQWISNYANKLIPIPPLPVQTEIVKILDALTALTSELTSELTLRRKQYEYYREKLLSEEELIKLGATAENLGDVTSISSGGTPSTKEPAYWVGGNIPWIKSESCKNKLIDEIKHHITEVGLQNSNAKLLSPNTTLMAMVGATIFKTAFLPFEATTNQNIAAIKSKNELSITDKFIFYYLTNMYDFFISKLSGYNMVNLSQIKNIKILLPPLEEQQRIVAILDKFEALTNSITEGLPLAIEQSQKRYEYYRELLLNFS